MSMAGAAASHDDFSLFLYRFEEIRALVFLSLLLLFAANYSKILMSFSFKMGYLVSIMAADLA